MYTSPEVTVYTKLVVSLFRVTISIECSVSDVIAKHSAEPEDIFRRREVAFEIVSRALYPVEHVRPGSVIAINTVYSVRQTHLCSIVYWSRPTVYISSWTLNIVESRLRFIPWSEIRIWRNKLLLLLLTMQTTNTEQSSIDGFFPQCIPFASLPLQQKTYRIYNDSSIHTSVCVLRVISRRE
jgi:hypothetical protein